MARPLKEVDEKLVVRAAKLDCTMEEIAAISDCSVDTLGRRFAEVIKKAREQGKCSLRRMQWKSARNGSIAMQIWLGKQCLGQRDKTDVTSKGESVKGYVGFDPEKDV